MDIFQQWLLLKIQESFGSGEEPLKKEISFEAIKALIGPIFEQEDAALDEDDLRRNLDALAGLGYLKAENGTYFLTFRALVYAEASLSVGQLVREQLLQLAKLHAWKAIGIAVGAIVLLSAIVSAIMIAILK